MAKDMSGERTTSATVAWEPTASAYDWNQAWEAGLTPWDRSGVQFALVELIDEFGSEWGLEDLKHGKALVPGCGRGYDVLFLSSKVEECYGLDISLKAIEEAQKVGSDTPKVTFLHADFFSFEIPDGAFQLAYDYTFVSIPPLFVWPLWHVLFVFASVTELAARYSNSFLCALPPSRRPEWSSRYSQLLEPGGRLITLIFPVDGDRPGGPPFSVDPDEIHELLTKAGFEKIYAKVPSRTNFPQRELMAVWKKL